jgi:hypothetical protein
MKNKDLLQDTFLYEFAIRMLAVLATILFSLLFFYGAVASVKTEFAGGKGTKAVSTTLTPTQQTKGH